MTRDQRQRETFDWAVRSFGFAHATSVEQRAVRFLEEAIELYQAAHGDLAMAHKLLDFVFARPVGRVGQELGGVGLTTMLLAAAAGLSADREEVRELQRVLSKPTEEFAERNKQKNEAGFDVTGGAYPTGFCPGDDQPCFVNSGDDDSHWRCGTNQCGKGIR